MKKIIKILILSLTILISFSASSFGDGDDLNIIKIGLQHTSVDLKTNKPSVIIKTDGVFEFGELVNDQYIKLLDFPNLNKLVFKCDNLYHVKVASFNSYEEAVDFMNISNINNMFVVKDFEYQVYAGSFDSPASTQNEINNISSSTGLNGDIVEVNKNLVMMTNSNNIIFGFDSSVGEYIVSPKNGDLTNNISYYADTPYRGGFGAKRVNTNDITIINYIRLDEYLYGVVPREMSKTWPIEALKAQAIVARNYAVANQGKFSYYGFNLDNTVNSQVYAGYAWEGPLSNQAVDETSGLSLRYGDTLVNAYYHSNSGGRTENSENVWSSVVPYLKGVDDPFSLGAPNDSWSLNLTPSYIQDRLRELGYDIGTLRDFYVQEYTSNDRAYKTIFLGTTDNVVLDKETIRKAFGYNEIKSTLIKIHPDNEIVLTDGLGFYKKRPREVYTISSGGKQSLISDTMIVYNGTAKESVNLTPTAYIVDGKGWGHGLGMSQWGAKSMADQGFTFEQILTHYYTGTHIE